MKRSTAVVEAILTRDKASRMTNRQLAAELLRCGRGMTVGANQAARSRFERRLHIMQDEADARMKGVAS